MSRLETRLQDILQALYRVEGPPAVAPFCTDALEGPPREALLVRSYGEEVELSLHLARSVRAGALRFLDHLGRGVDARFALDDFCAAVEGVAHFVYLTYCSLQGRAVSRLELELQAEIDKYILLRIVLGIRSPELVACLYDEVTIICDGPDRERYRVANREARRYARWIEGQDRRGRMQVAMEDARRFYRLPVARKLDRIARAA